MNRHPDQFPTETSDLSEAKASEVIELADGGEFELKIAPVVKEIGDARRTPSTGTDFVLRTATTEPTRPRPRSRSAAGSGLG